jgi:hypothetical protein
MVSELEQGVQRWMCWNNRGVNRKRSRSRRVMMVVVTGRWFSRYRGRMVRRV